MTSFNIPRLINKIVSDIPALNTLLAAMCKWDVSAYTDLPDGAMKGEVDTNNRLTFKKLVSGAWTKCAKLMHDVDTVDSYHAAVTPAASMIAVRNADGVVPGDITGNANTATTASGLSETNPVNKGGTGATTASGARANLGVPPTSHALNTGTYGLATDTLYGHAKCAGTVPPAVGTGNAGTPNGVFANADHTHAAPGNMTGATSSVAGASGLVPAPAAGDQGNYLKGDGTWGGALSDAVNSDSSTTGASSKAVKAAKDSADSAQAAASAALTTANNALPKTGGELSGAVVVPGNVNNLDFGYSYSSKTGGILALRSANFANNPGGVELIAQAGSNISVLSARASGPLQWKGNNVALNVNGVGADDNGRIGIPTVSGRTANGFTLPGAGTWMWIIATDSSSEVSSMSTAGYAAGGSYINSGIPGYIGFAYFAFRVA